MRDVRLDQLANVLVRYSTRVKPGDLVGIWADPIAMPLVEATYEAVLLAGGHPFFCMRSHALEEIILSRASDEQLKFFSPLDMLAIEKADVRIGFWSEINTRGLSGIDPTRIALNQSARRPFMKTFMKRAAEGSLRWCGTLFPTLAAAQDAEMSFTDYTRFVFQAGLLHLPDPVAAWTAISERQQRVCDFLQKKSVLRFQAPAEPGRHDGTDLTVDVNPAKSRWVNCCGHENFPDGEVFTGPQGVDGRVNYTFPAVYHGREVIGVRLQFKGGRVVDASALKGEDYLIKMLDQDPGARTLGEIAIGTNYAIKQFSRNTLFDEKIGGTFHAAVGAGYPESGSDNESGLHWDMVCELRPGPSSPGGTISADGEVFHKDGRFITAGWPGSD